MIKKKENCKYCGEKMESRTAKKSFCSEKCRVYFNRESKYSKTKPLLEIIDTTREPNILANLPIKEVDNKKQMPKGLSLSERIKWLDENEKL
jgi:predicted nucleic acid-binding Zn ribbon protein